MVEWYIAQCRHTLCRGGGDVPLERQGHPIPWTYAGGELCTLFQAAHQSPLTAMSVAERVVAGFTALVARWRTQMATTQSTAHAPLACVGAKSYTKDTTTPSATSDNNYRLLGGGVIL